MLRALARGILYVVWLTCCLIIGAALGTLITGCSAVHSDGQGRVGLGDCDIIVNDTLGTVPKRHGGPVSRAQEGTGIDCVLVRFD